MKALFIGDVHIKHSNVEETDALISAISTTKNVDFVVIAGDVLHTHEKIDSQLMNRAYQLVKTARRVAKTFVLVGNHDYVNNQQFLTDYHWMNGMKEWKDVVVVDFPIIWNNFVFCPYVFPGRFVEALSKLGNEWKTTDCIFAHQEIKGCKMGAFQSLEGDEWNEDWPMLISGHIHDRQTVGKNVSYPGSVLSHGYEFHVAGFSVFSFHPFSEEKIPIDVPAKKTVRINVGDKIKSKDLTCSSKFVVSGTRAEMTNFKRSYQFEEIKRSGAKIALKIKEQNDVNDNEPPERICFAIIFSRLVEAENDELLKKDFELVTKERCRLI